MKTFLKTFLTCMCVFVFTTAHAQYGKLWWNPAQNGMGTPITQQSNINANGVREEIIFGVWFFYKTNAEPTWLAFSCKLSKDGLGRDGCADTLAYVESSPPVNYDASKFQPSAVGNMSIVFNSSVSATFTYNFKDKNGVTQAGTLAWVPQVFGNLGYGFMSYTDKVYVTYVGSYPYSVSKTGLTKVVNKTQFTTPGFGLFSCSLYEVPIETGIIPVQCTANVDNVRRTFYINPLTDELFLYTGTFVFDSTKFHSVPWGTNMPYGNSVGLLGAYAEVADGIYWGPWVNSQNLDFSTKSGTGYNFNAITPIARATGADVFKVIIKYSF